MKTLTNTEAAQKISQLARGAFGTNPSKPLITGATYMAFRKMAQYNEVLGNTAVDEVLAHADLTFQQKAAAVLEILSAA